MSAHHDGCREFRAALSRVLEGLPMPEELTVLGWHEHLLSCEECRALLEREEALEELLATLPSPKLPPDLARRVLLRLRESSGGLDSLLELAGVEAPAGLAERVTAGLRAERALDALLDRDVVTVPEGLAERMKDGAALERLLDLDPEPVTPAGLAARVLGGLERERRPVPAVRRFRALRSATFYAAAAAVLVMVTAVALWWGQDRALDPGRDDRVVVDEPTDIGDQELLANLEVLIDPTLWKGTEIVDPAEDLAVLLADELDVEDEVLLAFQEEEGW